MGRVAFTIAGAVIGAYFGNPALGAAIGGAIGGAIFDEDTNVVVEGPKLQDLNVASSAYGTPIPWVFGTQRIGSQMIWATDIIEVRQEETESAGGAKGGPSSSQTNVTYKYQGNAAMLFCRGPKDILMLWADGKLVYDTTGSGQIASGKFTGLMKTYSGTTTQEPDPTIQADIGVEDTPAYRDVCYMVMHDFWLEDFGNRLPQWNALVSDATVEFPTSLLDVSTLPPISFVAAAGVSLTGGVMTPDERYIITPPGAGDMMVIDVLAQQVVTQVDISPFFIFTGSAALKIDSANRVLFLNDNGGTEWGIYIMSFPSLEIQTVLQAPSSINLFPRLMAVSPMTGEPEPGIERSDRVAVMMIGGRTQVYPTAPGGNTTITMKDGTIFPKIDTAIYDIELSDFLSVSSPAIGFNNTTDGGANTDRDGFIWFTVSDSNPGQLDRDMYLVQLDAWAGAFMFAVEIPPPEGYGGLRKGELAYDPVGHKFAVHVLASGTFPDSDSLIMQYDIDTDIWHEEAIPITFQVNANNGSNFDGAWANADGGIWFQGGLTGRQRTEYVFPTHSIGRTLELVDDYGLAVSVYEGQRYDPLNNAVIITHPGTDIFYWLYLDRLSANNVTLKSVVDEISEEVGLDLTKIDTDELFPFIVRGYAINRRMSARSALEPLRRSYFFDATESDFKMTFIIRGAEPVLTLTDDDLGVSNDLDEVTTLLIETRKQEVELPLRIDFQYSDPNFEYQQGSQYAKRADEAVVTLNQIRLDTAIVFTASEAKDIAERQLYTPWVERDAKRTSTTWQHLALDPTDVILISLANGLSFRVYVLEIDTSIEGVIEITGVLQDPEVATVRGSVIGSEAEGFDPTKLIVSSGSAIFIMDIPLLQDSDDQVVPIIHSAASRIGVVTADPNRLEWLGARIDRSFDGVFYGEWTFHTSGSEVSYGTVPAALPATSAPWVWDRTNTIRVIMRNGALTSLTETQILDSVLNTALLGNEIIQFANATLNADGSYTLDTLLRARRGTDLWARSNNGIAHSINEDFVILTVPTINITPHVVDNLNRLQYFKGITVGSPGLANKTLTPVGRSKMPYAPYLVTADRHSYGDVEISWSRRTRVGGAIDWIAGPSEPPISEDTETYQIAVIDANGVEIASHEVVDTTQFEYSAVQSDIDFGTDLDPLTQTVDFIVYQISATVGRGFPSETVTA